MNNFMLTRSGKKFFPFAPRLDDIEINDIIHALSNICRFAGHTSKFYSVAQHSVIVAQTIELSGGTPIEVIAGLLHDAPEAYLIDLPTPIKEELPVYRSAEALWWDLICKQWGIPKSQVIEEKIKQADMRAFFTEARDLMGNPAEWRERTGYNPLSMTIVPMPPEEAAHMFLAHYNKYYDSVKETW